MILLRSLIFFLFLILTTLVYGLTLSILGWFMPLSWNQAISNLWACNNLWLLQHICGLRYHIEGVENLPHDAAIVMSKHQSTWETIALRGLLPKHQAWVLKRELMWVPVFGWAMATVNPIAIDRKAGRKAARQIIEKGTDSLNAGEIVIIFPEGTRTPPGECRKYGIGGGLLAEKSGYQVVPIAHNAGVFWKRRGLKKYPGTIQMIVGTPLDSQGKKASEITREVEDWIETTQLKLPQTLEQAAEQAAQNP